MSVTINQPEQQICRTEYVPLFHTLLDFYCIHNLSSNRAATWACLAWLLIAVLLIPVFLRRACYVIKKLKTPSPRNCIDNNETYCLFSVYIVQWAMFLLAFMLLHAVLTAIQLLVDLDGHLSNNFTECIPTSDPNPFSGWVRYLSMAQHFVRDLFDAFYNFIDILQTFEYLSMLLIIYE